MRVTLIAGVINTAVVAALAVPMGAAILVLAIAVVVLRYVSNHDGATANASIFENPLDIPFVLGFGALLAAVTIAAKLIGMLFGEGAVVGLAGITGFVDVDPITLAAAGAAGTSLTVGAAAQAILLASAANMVTKTVAAVSVGGYRFGWKLVLAGLLALAAGAAAFVWLAMP
jgi:uncharacterized membrane protein (DUF4010 family)